MKLVAFVLVPIPNHGKEEIYILSAMGEDGYTYYLDLLVAPYVWRKLLYKPPTKEGD